MTAGVNFDYKWLASALLFRQSLLNQQKLEFPHTSHYKDQFLNIYEFAKSKSFRQNSLLLQNLFPLTQFIKAAEICAWVYIWKIQTLLMTQAWSLILWWRNICILSVSFKHLKNLQELFYPRTSQSQSVTIQKVCTCLTLYSWSGPWVFKGLVFFWLLNLKFHLKGKTVLLSARWIIIIVLAVSSLT